MVVVMSGGFQCNTRGVYAHNVSNAYNINDDVNLVRGNHQITFGGNVSEYKVYQRCLVSGQGQYTFNGKDRKSTRLNSSHEWISYAVFCLKKKKEIKKNT